MDRDQSFISSAFSVYATEARKSIHNQHDHIKHLQAAHDELLQTQDTLQQLPAKLRREVMVPMGKHAFFPGHLTRTNEFTVHLGDQYYAEVTAQQARGILQRRQAAVADGISKAQQHLKGLQARLDMFQGSLDGIIDEPEAREIRSSLAESDALLATAPKRPAAAAAAGQLGQAAATQQQQQQRIASASGYTYSRPQGLSTPQRTAQQETEDAELQARLEQLLLLEEQEELQDMLEDTPPLQQQQQLLLPHDLETIAEGDEEDEVPAAVQPAGSSTGLHGSGGGGDTAPPSAVQHLQQLDAEPDSDDEDEPQHPPLQPAAQQQPTVRQQQQQQRPQLSALKKGFFGPSSTSSSSEGTGSSRASQATRSSQETAAATQPRPTAFTGTVVEHVAPLAVAAEATPAGQVVAGRPAADAGSSTKPMSKFKLRRMGLEPPAE